MKDTITQKEFISRTGMKKNTVIKYTQKGLIKTFPQEKVKGVRTLYLRSEVAKWKK